MGKKKEEGGKEGRGSCLLPLRGEEKEELPWEGEEEEELPWEIVVVVSATQTATATDGKKKKKLGFCYLFSDFGFKSEPDHYIKYKTESESEMFGSDRVNPIS